MIYQFSAKGVSIVAIEDGSETAIFSWSGSNPFVTIFPGNLADDMHPFIIVQDSFFIAWRESPGFQDLVDEHHQQPQFAFRLAPDALLNQQREPFYIDPYNEDE
ncbi:MAG: hypothetical protein HY582_04815, partial [Candidatus Omnitrophica bacterium]|nr:hypothetical protein [Candidatus Omnitrophota bacterium]